MKVMSARLMSSLVRVPAGALIIAMQGLAGETVRERRRRERRALYELKLAEWYIPWASKHTHTFLLLVFTHFFLHPQGVPVCS